LKTKRNLGAIVKTAKKEVKMCKHQVFENVSNFPLLVRKCRVWFLISPKGCLLWDCVGPQ